MKVYTAGKSVDVSFPLTDDTGRVVTPTMLQYAVFDDEEGVLQSNMAISASGSGKVSFSVPETLNQLTGELKIGFRRVVLTITAVDGTYTKVTDYLLEDAQVFTIPGNSFQTYETSLIMARTITPLNGWDSASIETRKHKKERNSP